MKQIVIYYSLTGVVEKTAKLVAKAINADMYRIQSARKYDLDMWVAWDQAQVEREHDDMPPLIGGLPDISKYDRVIVGGPVWGYTISNPIQSYLQQTDFLGKAVSAFWTYYDHDEKYVSSFKAVMKNGNYQDGLGLTMSILDNEVDLTKNIDQWVDQLVND